MGVDYDTLSRGERTRQAILDGAEKLFLSQGYNGTSMREIAHSAGDIAVGGIYNHFDGKEDVFRALIEARSPFDEVVETLESLDQSDGPTLLADAFGRLHAIIIRNISFFGLVLIDIQEFEARMVRDMIMPIIPYVMQFGGRLREVSGIEDEIEYLVLMRVFASVLIGYAITDLLAYSPDGQLLLPGVPSLGSDFWQTQIVDVLLNGMAAHVERADSLTAKK